MFAMVAIRIDKKKGREIYEEKLSGLAGVY